MADAGPAIYSQTQPVPLDLFFAHEVRIPLRMHVRIQPPG